MKKIISITVIVLIAILATVFVFLSMKSGELLSSSQNEDSSSETNENETLSILYEDEMVKISLEQGDKDLFVFIQDQEKELTIPIIGDVGTEVSFVNDRFIAINISSSAGLAHLEGGYLIDRSTQEIDERFYGADRLFLGFTQDGSGYFAQDHGAEIFLHSTGDDVSVSFGEISVNEERYLSNFYPLRADSSPDDKIVIISGVGFYDDGNTDGGRENERRFLYAISLEDGSISLVDILEHDGREIEWSGNTSFNLSGQIQGPEYGVIATYELSNGEWITL